MSDVGIIPVNFTGYLLAATHCEMKKDRREVYFIVMTERNIDSKYYHVGIVFQSYSAFEAVSQLESKIPADANDLLRNGIKKGKNYLTVRVSAKGMWTPVSNFQIAGTAMQGARVYVITDLNHILPD